MNRGEAPAIASRTDPVLATKQAGKYVGLEPQALRVTRNTTRPVSI